MTTFEQKLKDIILNHLYDGGYTDEEIIKEATELKATLWHSYPEQPDGNKQILLYHQHEDNDYDYDIAWYQQIKEGSRFIYTEDFFLPDMVEALHKYEENISKED